MYVCMIVIMHNNENKYMLRTRIMTHTRTQCGEWIEQCGTAFVCIYMYTYETITKTSQTVYIYIVQNDMTVEALYSAH